MKRLSAICVVPFLLSACATFTEYEQKVSGWIGSGVDELYSVLGKPSSTETQPDGGKIITYEQKEVVKASPETAKPADNKAAQAVPVNAVSAAPAVAPAAESPANTRIVSCTTRYRTDSTGVIRSWTFDGEGCKAHEEPTPQQP